MIESRVQQAINLVKELKNSQQVYSVDQAKQQLREKIGLSRPGAGTWLAHISWMMKHPQLYPEYDLS